VDKWNLLSDTPVNSYAVNAFETHLAEWPLER